MKNQYLPHGFASWIKYTIEYTMHYIPRDHFQHLQNLNNVQNMKYRSKLSSHLTINRWKDANYLQAFCGVQLQVYQTTMVEATLQALKYIIHKKHEKRKKLYINERSRNKLLCSCNAGNGMSSLDKV